MSTLPIYQQPCPPPAPVPFHVRCHRWHAMLAFSVNVLANIQPDRQKRAHFHAIGKRRFRQRHPNHAHCRIASSRVQDYIP
jgi:hypothetical protein